VGLFFRGHLLGGLSRFGLTFLLQAVAIAADVDHRGAMQQAVQRSRGHDGIAGKDLAPIGEGLIVSSVR